MPRITRDPAALRHLADKVEHVAGVLLIVLDFVRRSDRYMAAERDGMPDQDKFAKLTRRGRRAGDEIAIGLAGGVVDFPAIGRLLDLIWHHAQGSTALESAVRILEALDDARQRPELPGLREPRPDEHALTAVRSLGARSMLDVLVSEAACRAILAGESASKMLNRLLHTVIARFAVHASGSKFLRTHNPGELYLLAQKIEQVCQPVVSRATTLLLDCPGLQKLGLGRRLANALNASSDDISHASQSEP